jgi:methionine salvage enolase-phosphatase E1
LTDKESSQKILAKIGEQPEGVIFITKSAEEPKASKETRITTILVVTNRRNIEKLDESQKQITRIRLLNELEFE